MPKINNNPLRLHRLRNDAMSQSGLAKAAGVSRSTVVAIEEGRTVNADPKTLAVLETTLGVPDLQLGLELQAWHADRQRTVPTLGPVQIALLTLSPHEIPQRFTSFAHWRSFLASSSTAFAQMLGVNHATVANYERGLRVRGLPEVLQHRLMQKLELSIDYIEQLADLPPGEPVDEPTLPEAPAPADHDKEQES